MAKIQTLDQLKEIMKKMPPNKHRMVTDNTGITRDKILHKTDPYLMIPGFDEFYKYSRENTPNFMKLFAMEGFQWSESHELVYWEPGDDRFVPTSKPDIPEYVPSAPTEEASNAPPIIFRVKNRENIFTFGCENEQYLHNAYSVLRRYAEADVIAGVGKRAKHYQAYFVFWQCPVCLRKLNLDKEHDKSMVVINGKTIKCPGGKPSLAMADIGLLYYCADHLISQKYRVVIDDQRKKIANNFIEIEGHPDKKGRPFKFRDYQHRAIEAALKRKNGILRLATGSGKTEIGIGLIGKLGEDALFIVPNKNLAKQTRDRFRERGFPHVGILYGEKPDPGEPEIEMIPNTPGQLDVNVAVINSVEMMLGVSGRRKSNDPVAKKRFETQKKIFFDFMKEANVLVFDEAHHVKATTYAAAARANPASFRYGLSATPFADTPKETLEVREKLGDILYDLPASKLIEYEDGNQYLSQPIIKLIANPIADDLIPLFNKIYAAAVERAETRAAQRGEILTRMPNRYPSFIEAFIALNKARNKLVADICVEGYKRAMPTLIVVEKIEQGVQLKMMLDKMNIPKHGEYPFKVEMVASKEDPGEETEIEEEENEAVAGPRVEIITDVKSKDPNVRTRDMVFKDVAMKKTHVLIGTTGMVGEGLDINELMLCIVLQGGKSFTRTYQRIGRAMRLHLGESTDFRRTHCIIVDILDGMDVPRMEFTQAINEAMGGIPTPGFYSLMYLGMHFFRRMLLYQAEKHYVISWAKNVKDVFKVMLKDGTIIDPWGQ
jgi:superfamily II DNA or RNA helicase